MKILDIDMDFFQNKILMYGDIHYNTTDCIAWSELELRNFLEKNLRLSNHKKINGVIVEKHHEVYKYIKNITNCRERNKIIHVDAHADLGYIGDASFLYLKNNNYTNSEDIFSHPDYGKKFCMSESNYLLFTIADGLFYEIDYIYHPQLEIDGQHDLPPTANKKYKDNYLLYELELSSKIKIPINMCRYKDYYVDGEITYVTVSKSQSYCISAVTPLVDIVKEYINIEN